MGMMRSVQPEGSAGAKAQRLTLARKAVWLKQREERE